MSTAPTCGGRLGPAAELGGCDCPAAAATSGAGGGGVSGRDPRARGSRGGRASSPLRRLPAAEPRESLVPHRPAPALGPRGWSLPPGPGAPGFLTRRSVARVSRPRRDRQPPSHLESPLRRTVRLAAPSLASEPPVSPSPIKTPSLLSGGLPSPRLLPGASSCPDFSQCHRRRPSSQPCPKLPCGGEVWTRFTGRLKSGLRSCRPCLPPRRSRGRALAEVGAPGAGPFPGSRVGKPPRQLVGQEIGRKMKKNRAGG